MRNVLAGEDGALGFQPLCAVFVENRRLVCRRLAYQAGLSVTGFADSGSVGQGGRRQPTGETNIGKLQQIGAIGSRGLTSWLPAN